MRTINVRSPSDGSQGRALIATGSPFAPVTIDGRVLSISQANNIYVFPGLGVGALAARAQSVSDGMLRAAAAALADSSPCGRDSIQGELLPPLADVASTACRIAMAVARTARDEGVADAVDDGELSDRIEARSWSPAYPEIVATR